MCASICLDLYTDNSVVFMHFLTYNFYIPVCFLATLFLHLSLPHSSVLTTLEDVEIVGSAGSDVDAHPLSEVPPEIISYDEPGLGKYYVR